MRDIDYLELLSKKFPTTEKACIEIANLNAILTLPKGTEYFLSDLHGEYDSFVHVLHSASGIIRTKITYMFSDKMTPDEILELSNLIYFPEEKTEKIDFTNAESKSNINELIKKLIIIVRDLSSKYSKSKIRKLMDAQYSYILDELLFVNNVERDDKDKDYYYDEIIDSIVDIGLSKSFIVSVCKLIQKLAVDKLHIIGDVFDRGPRHDLILDELINFHNLDIEWGNHDAEWMGAALGNDALILCALRNAVRYNCFDMLEDGYGINLRALNDFVINTYKDDDCNLFMPKILDENKIDIVRPELSAKMQKALAIMQFKVEGKLIKKHPEYDMDDRVLLERIDYKNGTINIEGKNYKLLDTYFPTIDNNNPLELSKEEEIVFNSLKNSFMNSDRLKKHLKFLYDNGSLYKIYNGNLMYHGIIPFNDNGDFYSFSGFEKNNNYKSKELLDYFEQIMRNAYKDYLLGKKDSNNIDAMFYMWCGKYSPLFGKDKIRTFELYFVDDKEIQKEIKNPYYTYYCKEDIAIKILDSFGLNKNGHIINGHVPVKALNGESPIKANGRLFVIDGGLSKSYQKSTGIAGYTLISDSIHLTIATHKPYQKGKFNTPDTCEVENIAKDGRLRIKDTDIGKDLVKQINDLKDLIYAYKNGIIQEN